ncbi:MAG TPA: cytochrome P450 [Caulobacteraceae bacterium]|nr:cytochrome P450 [Caulobacteraceae bacterium]
MADGSLGALEAARAEAWATPLEAIDVSVEDRFAADTIWPFFERLRKEDPVHWCADTPLGAYWSITRFADIVEVEVNHEVFSSAKGISIYDGPQSGEAPAGGPEGGEFKLDMFIAMDPPKHDVQRKTVAPIVSGPNMRLLEPIIRERCGKILDELPIGEPFDWVDRVAVELTSQMLATLFGFPFEERRKLIWWSDLTTTDMSDQMTMEEARAELIGCGMYFMDLWNKAKAAPPRNELISMLAHGEATQDMPFMEFLGNILLLIVGGNDTTRNSISGGVLALNQYPDEYDRLRADPSLVALMVPEIIRWQTPVAHMRRTATADFELAGKTIRAGDKVVMWYASANRDEALFEDANAFRIGRERPRQHAAFGFGIHRCVGMRLAEMQLKMLWEEIMKRFPTIEVVGEPVRLKSNFLRAIRKMDVIIPSRL